MHCKRPYLVCVDTNCTAVCVRNVSLVGLMLFGPEGLCLQAAIAANGHGHCVMFAALYTCPPVLVVCLGPAIASAFTLVGARRRFLQAELGDCAHLYCARTYPGDQR